MKTKISGYVISNVGVKKFANEDNYLINGKMNEAAKPINEEVWQQACKSSCFGYAAVLDGMGGGECGQQASQFAAQELRKALDKVSSDADVDTIDRLARQGFLNANRRIIEERRKHSILGTTATLLCLKGNYGKLFHLGDSRAYLYRENQLMQLTKDQTLANLKIDAGIYGADAPEAEADRNLLTEYIGADETMEEICPLESRWIALHPRDKIILCSDGLYHFCSDEEIRKVLQEDKTSEELADLLVCAALEKGGTDNITCLVATVESSEG